MGPFQDLKLKELFSFDGYSIPKISSFGSNLSIPSINVNNSSWFRDNTFLILMVSVISVLLLMLVIPSIVAKFVETPFCDTNSNEIKGEYAIFNGIIPLQNTINCKLCPVNASCYNGTVNCGDNHYLDQYRVVCLPQNGDKAKIAKNAASISYQV